MSDTPQGTDPQPVSDHQQASRFELAAGGQLAELVYRRRADRLVLVHTGVPRALEGHGAGGQLVAAAVSRAAAEGLTVVPLCSFARSWLRSHPDVAGTATIDWGEQPSAG
ncbi:MAG: N-acetyltransferase [Actinomycetota bacterium]|nr:N-acetyltransferase [Actinomycetota bacterium]